MKFSKWAYVGVGVTLFVILFILYSFFRTKANEVKISKGNLVEAVYALGTVRAAEHFDLKFGIASSVKELYIEEGAEVKKGDALLTNDSGILFRSPIHGTITKLNVSKNETIMPGLIVLTVQSLDKVFILVSLDQESALRIKPGQKVELSFESIRGNVYGGKVERIYPSAGQFLVKIFPEDLPDGILPDMTTDVAIQVSEKRDVVLVPLVAVDRGKVQRIRNNKREKIDVRIGAINSEYGELIKGDLLEGDTVLIRN